MQNKIKTFAVSILIPLAVGGLAALITRGSMDAYGAMEQPPLSPPAILFPIVWTILYTLMGISSGIIYLSENPKRSEALKTYALQLLVNFFWPVLFFNFGAYFVSLLWLLLLIILVAQMILQFRKISPLASYLQIPYLIWLLFAAYLNAGVWLLNR